MSWCYTDLRKNNHRPSFSGIFQLQTIAIDSYLSILSMHDLYFIFHMMNFKSFGSEAHPASDPVGTGVLSSGVKRPGREANHSSPSSAEVKNV
jgi:hypothetical protein